MIDIGKDLQNAYEEGYKQGGYDEKVEAEMSLPQRWIPVSERLPERDGEYLVSTLGIISGRTYTQVGEFSTSTKSWIVYDSEYGYVPLYDVLAWMPLPEPYKEDESE